MSDTDKPSPDYGPVESIAEDVIGFNFRSFRTIRDLLVRPNLVFRTYAAKSSSARRDKGHVQDREEPAAQYTPALRLWLGLTVIQAILSYFFGGHAEMMTRIIGNMPEAQRNTILEQSGGDLAGVTEAYAQTFSFIQPIAIISFMILTVFLTAMFRRGHSWVARINITYSVLIPGTIVALAAFPLLVQRPELGLPILIPVWMAYWITLFRGAPGVLSDSLAGRVIKATVFSVITLTLVFAAGLVTIMISMQQALSAV